MLSDLRFRLRALFDRRTMETEMEDELRFHFERQVEKNRNAGMAPDEAMRQARLSFGGTEQIKEQCREARGISFLDSSLQDIRYGFRGLCKRKGFAAVAILTIAVGIAANVSVFGFFSALFLRAVPARDPSRMVRIFAPTPNGDGDGFFSYPEYAFLLQHAQAFESVTAHYSTAPLYAIVDGQAFEVQGAVVSGNYFSLLGLQPSLGRFFNAEDDKVADRDAVAVVSYALWQSVFHGDRRVIGTPLTINGRTFEVIGVAPEDFYGVQIGATPNQIWIPTMMAHAGYRWCDALQPDCTIFSLLARLKPGFDLGVAQAEVKTLWNQFRTAHPDLDDRRDLSLTPAVGVEGSSRTYFRTLLDLLLAVAGALLLVVCANIAGLLIAQGSARRSEFAIRRSLGASSSRIVRQLLIETLLLAGGASILGLGLSVWISHVFSAFYGTDSEGYRHIYNIKLDAGVLIYSIALTLVTGIGFGLIPAIQASQTDINETLKNSGGARGSVRSRSRSLMVATQVALSFALLVASGLLIRSTATLDDGTNLDVHHVVGLRLRPRLVGYSPVKAQAFLHEVVRRVDALPGVEAVSLTKTEGPVWGNGDTMRLAVPGRVYAKDTDEPEINSHEIAPEYFQVLHIPFVAGRDFGATDREGFPRVAIVNETLAKRLFGKKSPLGQTITLDDQRYQIVGLVKDAQIHKVLDEPVAMAYLPFWQNDNEQQIDARMCVRAAGDGGAVLTAIRKTITEVDPSVPVTETMPLLDQVRATYSDARMAGMVLTVVGLLTLGLSAMGLFGVIAYEVNQQTREIGIRIAFGAQPSQVVRHFLARGVILVFWGMATGTALALASSRLLNVWLFGVQAWNPATFLIVGFVLATVATLAIYIPSRRAAAVNPLVALHYE
jgi:putative ABC transport system permease protein